MTWNTMIRWSLTEPNALHTAVEETLTVGLREQVWRAQPDPELRASATRGAAANPGCPHVPLESVLFEEDGFPF